jgi:S1-C subfamily serine protease
MRALFAGFGLLSLLVCVGIMLYLMSMEAPAVHEGVKAQDEAQQISGHGANGMPAMQSYTAESYPPGGNSFRGVRIKDVTIGGPMDTYYGLKVGDVVLQIGGMDVTAFGDYESAKGQLDQAYQEFKLLLVQRGGNQITLPVGGTGNPLEGFKTQ